MDLSPDKGFVFLSLLTCGKAQQMEPLSLREVTEFSGLLPERHLSFKALATETRMTESWNPSRRLPSKGKIQEKLDRFLAMKKLWD